MTAPTTERVPTERVRELLACDERRSGGVLLSKALLVELCDDLLDARSDRDALAARLASLREAAMLVRDAQAVAAAAKARYEATWGTADGAPVRTDAEKITAALTAWHVAGDALDTALVALVADALAAPLATTEGA